KLLAGTPLSAILDEKTGAYAIRKETETKPKNAFGAAPGSARPEKLAETSDGKPNETDNAALRLPAYTVTGSKTFNADISRTRDDPQPYVVFDRAVLTKSGASTLNEFFKTRLPMNSAQDSANQSGGTNANTSEINLRGLGSNQTLILVDG